MTGGGATVVPHGDHILHAGLLDPHRPLVVGALVPLLDALGSWWDATEAGRSRAGMLPVQVTE